MQLLGLLWSLMVEDFIFIFFNDLCFEAWVFLGLMSSDSPKWITVPCEVCISYVLSPL